MPLPGGEDDTPVPSVITSPLVVVSVVFPVLAAVSIYLRLIAKRRIRQPYHADDWWVIATWVCLVSLAHRLLRRPLADCDQFLTIPMSILFWVFAAKSGVDSYDIDRVQGTYDSLEVRRYANETHYLLRHMETDVPNFHAVGCVSDGLHTSIAAVVCQDICIAFLQTHICDLSKVERLHMDRHRCCCCVVYHIHRRKYPIASQHSEHGRRGH